MNFETFSLKQCVTKEEIYCYEKVLVSFKLFTIYQISEA